MPKTRSKKLVATDRGALRRGMMVSPGHRFLQRDRQAPALAARQEGTAGGRPVPCRGTEDHRRSARQRAAARDRGFSAEGAKHPARRRDHCGDRSGGRRSDRDDARHPLQDERQGQSADAARRLSTARNLAASDRPIRGADLWIVAQALRDPGNLGTILRTGDAAGAGGLILDRRLRRSFLGRSGARLDGRDVHAGDCRSALGRIRRHGCARAKASSSAPASRQRTIIWRPSIASPASC